MDSANERKEGREGGRGSKREMDGKARKGEMRGMGRGVKSFFWWAGKGGV